MEAGIYFHLNRIFTVNVLNYYASQQSNIGRVGINEQNKKGETMKTKNLLFAVLLAAVPLSGFAKVGRYLADSFSYSR